MLSGKLMIRSMQIWSLSGEEILAHFVIPTQYLSLTVFEIIACFNVPR